MAQKKTPKGYISLLKAVELVSKKGPFTTKDDPAEAAREWLFEQFRFGCLVPVVGYWKIPSGYWTLLGRQSMDSGFFEPGNPEQIAPQEWQDLRDEPLSVFQQELKERLAVLDGATIPNLSQHSLPSDFLWSVKIEGAFTNLAPLKDIQKTFPKATEADYKRAFSDPMIAAANKYARYQKAAEREAEAYVAANPPALPERRRVIEAVSVSLCEALTWIATGNAQTWADWVFSNTAINETVGLVEAEEFRSLLSQAEDALRDALAKNELVARHTTNGEYGEVPREIFESPDPQMRARFDYPLGDSEIVDVGGSRRTYERIYFRTDDLRKCWPNGNTEEKNASENIEIEYTARRARFVTDRGRGPSIQEDEEWRKDKGVKRDSIRHLRRLSKNVNGRPAGGKD